VNPWDFEPPELLEVGEVETVEDAIDEQDRLTDLENEEA